jgi:hypothetical protein
MFGRVLRVFRGGGSPGGLAWLLLALFLSHRREIHLFRTCVETI